MVYRGGDQVGSWAYAGLVGLGLSMTGIAIVAVPLSVTWLALSVWIERRQERANQEIDKTIERETSVGALLASGVTRGRANLFRRITTADARPRERF